MTKIITATQLINLQNSLPQSRARKLSPNLKLGEMFPSEILIYQTPNFEIQYDEKTCEILLSTLYSNLKIDEAFETELSILKSAIFYI